MGGTMENSITERAAAYSDLPGYEAFMKDLKRLEIANSMSGLCQIRAEVWLEKLDEISDEGLAAYIERYQAGWLDPFEGYGL